MLISLDCEPGELADPEVRAAIKEVGRALERAGIPPTRLMYARNGAVMAALPQLGPYLVPMAQIVIPTLGAILTAWVKTPGRKVRVKVGDVQIETASVDEVERLLPRLKEFQAKRSKTLPADNKDAAP